jgi:C-terminal processing protease CtpA/Prc
MSIQPFRALACTIAVSIAIASSACSQTSPDSLTNLNFEIGEPGQSPPSWSHPNNLAYVYTLTDENPHEGRQALRIQRSEASPDASFGTLTRRVDAAPYRGKLVRLRAAVRSDVPAGQGAAQLWMRVDRSGGRRGFFDNMQDRPITDTEWAYYEITGDVAEDAEYIFVGAMLIGSGTAWVDDVSFEVVGEVEPLIVEPSRPLTDRGLRNLVAFARMLGYVRHFHPSDQAAGLNWNAFAVEGVRSVEGASNAEDLAARLNTLFEPIAPAVQIGVTPPAFQPPEELFPSRESGSLQIVRWNHLGYGTANLNSIYRSDRSRTPLPEGITPAEAFSDTLLFTADLDGLSVLVPLAVLADSAGTYPRVSVPDSLTGQMRFTANDRATRLATVVLAWNILQHFYPYFDVVDVDWDLELRQALNAAAEDSSEEAFLKTLRLMVAALEDGHGNVYGPAPEGSSLPPFLWSWVKDSLVITHVLPAAQGLLYSGDVVLTVDGKEAATVIAEAEQYISGATPQWKRYKALEMLRAGGHETSLELVVQRSNRLVDTVEVRRTYSLQAASRESRPEAIAELEPRILYVNLDVITEAAFQTALPQLAGARGIIFDMRGYPRMSPAFLQHLSLDTLASAHWMVPVVQRPDRQGWTYDLSGRWMLPPLQPHLSASIIFLTDGSAISFAESVMGIVEHHGLGEIIGSATAGTNGNINQISLPGGYQMIFTGMKVLKHDGSQHHAVGIYPTVPVERTIEGIRQGRDEVLNRALEILRAELN